MNSTLAERFKYLRRIRAQATQDDLASVMQVKRFRVADIERGKVRELKADEAVRLAAHFKVDGWWLMTGEGEAEVFQPSEAPVESLSESGYIPQWQTRNLLKEMLSGAVGNVEFVLLNVSSKRFEPLVPQGSTLVLERTGRFKDGDYLLIETENGVYIKQYRIELGQSEGFVYLDADGGKTLPFSALRAGGERTVRGRVAGYLKMFATADESVVSF